MADDPNTPEDERNDPTLDFGFTELGSLGSTIFPMPGVDVTLTYPDGTTETVATDANGMYLFDGLPLDQTYTVTVDTSTVSGKDAGATGDPSNTADETSEGTTSLSTTLTADETNTPEDESNDPTLDFGFTSLGSLGNTIFHDANNDGIFDPADGDFPMEGVDVTLTHPDGSTETVTTDANGFYEFTDLTLNQSYSVTVDTSTIDDKEDGVTGDPSLTDDQTSEGTTTLTTMLTGEMPSDPTLDFGFTKLGSLGNTIFHDANNDGIFDPADGDFPMPGVDVVLTHPDGSIETVTTDVNGYYEFTDLPLNQSYSVTVDTDTIGDKDMGATGDSSLTADQTSEGTTTLTTMLTDEMADDPTLDFGFTNLGSIGDLIFHDADGDGVYEPDDGDFPLDGVPVTLTDATGAVVATVTTDSAGMYLFDNLPLGDYTVTVDPTGLINKLSSPSADPDGGADSTSQVRLTADAPDDRDQDFGYEPVPEAPPLGAIGDLIFHDADGDGVYEPDDGDFPLEGVPVTLTDAAGAVVATATTNEDGEYFFGALPLGEYTVTVDPTGLINKLSSPSADPDGGADNTSTVVLTAMNPVDTEQDFGYEPVLLGSIGDLIFHDADGDGVYEPDDGDFPLPGVRVTLTDESGTSQTVTTDASGLYLFEDLPLDATYSVMVNTSDLTNKQSMPSADPDGGADSISEIRLMADDPNTPGDEANDRDQDFGYEPIANATLGAIGDTIFHDADGDGVYEPDDGDLPLAGVTVTLTDAEGNTQTTATDSDGKYLFSDLPMGDYTVTVDTTGLPDSKSITPSADPDGGPGGIGDSTSMVTLTETAPVDLDQDFGYEPAPLGSIGDKIFHDANQDGLCNPTDGDFELPTVTVNLLDAGGNVIASTQTNVNGYYLFDNLPMGDYTVQVDTTTLPAGKVTSPTADPDGGADSVSNVTLTPANPDNSEQDFGYPQDPNLASLGNYYWIDTDADGIKDPLEKPVVGALVTLYGPNGGVVATTTTDANGFFSFAVEPGDYSLEFELPNGYRFTEQDREGGYDSDVDPRTGRTVSISIGPGQHDPNWGAGIVLGAPAAVNLSSFTVAQRGEDELVVSWTTSAEVDTAGFQILLSSDGTLANARQVTSQRVPSQGSAGGSYEVVLLYNEATDAPLSTISFWLYEVETDGTINYYGPAMMDVDASQMDQFMFLPFLSQ